MIKDFTPLEWLYIGIANAYGLDKKLWEERLQWAYANESSYLSDVEALAQSASEPFMFRKLVNSLKDHKEGLPVSCLVGIDCTASGLQLLSLMTGDMKAATHVNLVNNGKRNDIYSYGAEFMSSVCSKPVTRDMLKNPIMTTFYASTAKPKEIFGDGTPELQAYYEFLKTELEGPYHAMLDMMSCTDPNALSYSWTMPNGTLVHLPVMDTVSKKLEIDELDHKTFTMVTEVNKPKEYDRSLPANIVQSVDAFVTSELVRRCNFTVLPIHDCYYCSPVHVNEMRRTFNKILSEIPHMNLLQRILRGVTGDATLEYTLMCDPEELSQLVLEAEYALS